MPSSDDDDFADPAPPSPRDPDSPKPASDYAVSSSSQSKSGESDAIIHLPSMQEESEFPDQDNSNDQPSQDSSLQAEKSSDKSSEDSETQVKPAEKKRSSLYMDNDNYANLVHIQHEHKDAVKLFSEKKAKMEKSFSEDMAELESGMTRQNDVFYVERERLIAEGDDGLGIPFFWLIALKNNKKIALSISKSDEEVLIYLRDIKSLDGNTGFSLEFHFKENPFFTETLLKKEYFMVNGMVESSAGSPITWVDETYKENSEFFKFFQNPSDPKSVRSALALQMKIMDDDFELGSIFKSSIIPNAVTWFNGGTEM